jgi:hypothetical protein
MNPRQRLGIATVNWFIFSGTPRSRNDISHVDADRTVAIPCRHHAPRQ